MKLTGTIWQYVVVNTSTLSVMPNLVTMVYAIVPFYGSIAGTSGYCHEMQKI